jgi:D-alanyl-D-alanine carboxypeptidase
MGDSRGPLHTEHVMGERILRGRSGPLAVVVGAALSLSACEAAVDAPPASRTTDVAPSPVATTSAGAKSCDSEPRRAGPTLQEVLVEVVAGHDGGVVVAIGRDGDPVRICSAGRADTSGTPLEPDDAFRIGSITKTFTAVMILQLVDEGRLGLDDPVAKYLPDAPLIDGVTVRQLLNHTSGLPDVVELPSFLPTIFTDPERTWTPEDALGLLDGLERDFAPGSDHAYSNTNFMIAGMILAKVTGLGIAENLRTRITDPLGLAETALGPDGPEPVTGFSPDLPPDGHTEAVSYHALETWAGAAGGIVSTAEDLTVFFRALSAGEMLSATSMDEMTDFQGRAGAGLGLWRMRLPTGPGYGHGGHTPGYDSLAVVRPESGDVYVLLLNEDNLVPFQFERAIFRAW